MPLETRENYERLNEHLWELDPVAKAFADEMGYDYGPPLTNGLYPRLGLFHAHNETITSEIVNACHVKTPIHGHSLFGKVIYLD